jgi:hypothetical protein
MVSMKNRRAEECKVNGEHKVAKCFEACAPPTEMAYRWRVRTALDSDAGQGLGAVKGGMWPYVSRRDGRLVVFDLNWGYP